MICDEDIGNELKEGHFDHPPYTSVKNDLGETDLTVYEITGRNYSRLYETDDGHTEIAVKMKLGCMRSYNGEKCSEKQPRINKII